MAFYNKKINEVLLDVGADINGLSSTETKERLLKNGKNTIIKRKETNTLKIFLSQFSDILIILLIIAALISLILGQRRDAIVLFVIIFINSSVGFFQEYKASKSIEALKKMMSPSATVLRDGEKKQIPSEDLVVGDIIFLSEGDKISADARIIEENELKTDESMLTGESLPQKKSSELITKIDLLPQDQKNIVFTGTSVVHGNAKAVVVSTGMQTEFGKIANLTQTTIDDLSPLQKEILTIGKLTAKVALVIALSLIIFGIFKENNLLEIFIFAVSIAVAVVPEGLPTTLTVSLSIALTKLAKKNAIVRRLSSVETLGATTVICSDKTGTLTKNQMTVEKIFVGGKNIDVTGTGYAPIGDLLLKNKKIEKKDVNDLEFLLNIGYLCNNSKIISPNNENPNFSIIGDPTEGALIVLSEKTGVSKEKLASDFPRIKEIPFDSIKKRMITVHKTNKEFIALQKGAPDEVLLTCKSYLLNGKIKKLDDKTRKEIQKEIKSMASQALRVMAFSYKKSRKEFASRELEKEYVFIGLMGLMDPPREDVYDAVKKCKEAGIRINIVTGDFGETAKAIALKVGIATEETKVITGAELDKMDNTNLWALLKHECIFARTTPEHKLRIVTQLIEMGEVVAVTGDGVNDAPALKKASIGIAMGVSGTDVAKESSDMVLTDDSFSTIVSSIKEGRRIYDNLTKLVYYNLAGITGEVFTIFIAIVLGLIFNTSLIPLLAIQILLIDLGVEVLPSISFAFEPEEKGLMRRHPRNPKDRIINKNSIIHLAVIGVIISMSALFLFFKVMTDSGWTFGTPLNMHATAYIKATTMVFFTIIMFQMVNAFNSKTKRISLFETNIFENKMMIFAVLFSIGMMLAFSYIPFLNEILHTAPLGLVDWAWIIGLSSLILIFEEARKFVVRKTSIA